MKKKKANITPPSLSFRRSTIRSKANVSGLFITITLYEPDILAKARVCITPGGAVHTDDNVRTDVWSTGPTENSKSDASSSTRLPLALHPEVTSPTSETRASLPGHIVLWVYCVCLHTSDLSCYIPKLNKKISLNICICLTQLPGYALSKSNRNYICQHNSDTTPCPLFITGDWNAEAGVKRHLE